MTVKQRTSYWMLKVCARVPIHCRIIMSFVLSVHQVVKIRALQKSQVQCEKI